MERCPHLRVYMSLTIKPLPTVPVLEWNWNISAGGINIDDSFAQITMMLTIPLNYCPFHFVLNMYSMIPWHVWDFARSADLKSRTCWRNHGIVCSKWREKGSKHSDKIACRKLVRWVVSHSLIYVRVVLYVTTIRRSYTTCACVIKVQQVHASSAQLSC